MKKRIARYLLLVSMLVLTVIKTYALENTVCVPSQQDFRALGIEVEWKPYEQVLYASKDNILILLKPNSNEAWVNGNQIFLDNPLTINNDQIILPVEFICDTLGIKLGTDVNQTPQQDIDINQEVPYPIIEDIPSDINQNYMMDKITYQKGLITIQKQEGITLAGTKIEDKYRERQIIVDFNINCEKTMGSGTLAIGDEKLKSLNVLTENTTKIILDEQTIQAFEMYEDQTNLYIKLVKPKEKYNQIIFLDPGHGGTKPGAIYQNIKEKDINLKEALALRDLLQKNTTIKVYMSREDDTDHYQDNKEELKYRTGLANEIEADAFISIHNNSAGNTQIKGTETYYCAGDLTGKAIASIIQGNIVEACKMTDRKIKEDTGLVVIITSDMPAILIETGFMTNNEELMRLVSDDFNKAWAQAMYQGIIESFNTILIKK